MIRVTEKYGINILPDCYAVAVIYNSENDKGKAGNRWFYPSFEEALIKISKMTEKSLLPSITDLDGAIRTIIEVHDNTKEMIMAAVAAAGISERG